MEELTLRVLGTVPYSSNYTEKTITNRYPQGPGLYAVSINEQICGFIHVFEFIQNNDGTGACQFNEFLFPQDTLASFVMHSAEQELKPYFEKYFLNVLEKITDTNQRINGAFDALERTIKEHNEQNVCSKGITERAFLQALSIVAGQKTGNEIVK